MNHLDNAPFDDVQDHLGDRGYFEPRSTTSSHGCDRVL